MAQTFNFIITITQCLNKLSYIYNELAHLDKFHIV